MQMLKLFQYLLRMLDFYINFFQGEDFDFDFILLKRDDTKKNTEKHNDELNFKVC